MAERLLDEIRGSGPHGFHSQGDVAMSGDHDRRQRHLIRLEPRQQLEAVHSRQNRVDHQASFAAWPQLGQERLTARERLHEPPMRFEDLSNRIAYAGIVVDHEDGRG